MGVGGGGGVDALRIVFSCDHFGSPERQADSNSLVVVLFPVESGDPHMRNATAPNMSARCVTNMCSPRSKCNSGRLAYVACFRYYFP